jgi:lipopolysaccharide export system permease protein
VTIIDRYILRAILGATALVMLVFLTLAIVFTFIGEQGDVGVLHYTTLSAFWFSLLNLPAQAWDLLPIAALIGSLLGLGSLARGSELTVLRASGVSVARIAGSALIAAFVLIASEVILGELLAPPLVEAAQRNKAFDRFSNVSFGAGAAWVRDRDVILNVQQLASTREFGGMLVFELSADHRLLAIGRAARATANGKREWMLSGYTESRFTPERVLASSAPTRMLESNVGAGFLALATATPEQLGVRSLWTVINYYRANALDARRFVFAFWSRIARTIAIAFTVLLAIPFVLGALRSAGTGARMMVGLLLGIGFFLLQRLIESGTIVFNLNPVLLAWLPTMLLATITLGLLARAR